MNCFSLISFMDSREIQEIGVLIRSASLIILSIGRVEFKVRAELGAGARACEDGASDSSAHVVYAACWRLSVFIVELTGFFEKLEGLIGLIHAFVEVSLFVKNRNLA